MKNWQVDVFEKPITKTKNIYGVKFIFNNQTFKIDYYSEERIDAHWMCKTLREAIESLLQQNIINKKIEKIIEIIKDHEDLLFDLADSEDRCSGVNEQENKELIEYLLSLKKATD